MLSQARCASVRRLQCRSIISHRHLPHSRFLTVPTTPTPTPTPTPLSQSPPIRTAHVRTWEPPKNIAETYAILRVLERKYGRILEARFLKDYEDPTKYQMVFWVIFEDPESLERIPSKGGQFVFRPPKLIGEKHEISMEELESLAQSEDYLEDFDAIEQAEHQKGKDPTLGGGRIVRGEKDLVVPDKYFNAIFQMTPKPVMSAFLHWGGFQPLKPLPKVHVIEERELFGKTEVDRVRMRASLQLSARLLGVPDPSSLERTTGTDQPSSLSALVFGGANTSPSASSSKSEPTASPLPPPPTPKTATPKSAKQSKSTAVVEPQIPPPPKEKDAATIAAELKAQETLKRQLEFARKLKEQTNASRRKQPKPQIKPAPKEKLPSFFEEDTHQLEEPKPAGVFDRLLGMFGRK